MSKLPRRVSPRFVLAALLTLGGLVALPSPVLARAPSSATPEETAAIRMLYPNYDPVKHVVGKFENGQNIDLLDVDSKRWSLGGTPVRIVALLLDAAMMNVAVVADGNTGPVLLARSQGLSFKDGAPDLTTIARVDTAAYQFAENDIGFAVRTYETWFYTHSDNVATEVVHLFRVTGGVVQHVLETEVGTIKFGCLQGDTECGGAALKNLGREEWSEVATLHFLPTKTKGVFDLLKKTQGRPNMKYRWNGQRYAWVK